MVKAKNKLEALSTNEEVGDIVTHWMKSGSAFRASSCRAKSPIKTMNLVRNLYQNLTEVYHLNMTYGLILTRTILLENGYTQILWVKGYTFEFLP